MKAKKIYVICNMMNKQNDCLTSGCNMDLKIKINEKKKDLRYL